MRSIIGIAIVAVLAGVGYFYLQSDIGLLGDDTCLKIISDDVLGNPLYGKSCPRSSYAKEVESLHGGDKESGFFEFHPTLGKEAQCPPIAIIVDRKTGEAWIAR
ncbi:MAG: hypothetical protein KUL88_02545 [Rhizobium sp.]|nr:hypothetical protein [Rhizobium sp.]